MELTTMFSKELIKKARVIFEKQSGRVVSNEETEQCLHRLAKLGFLMEKSILRSKKHWIRLVKAHNSKKYLIKVSDTRIVKSTTQAYILRGI